MLEIKPVVTIAVILLILAFILPAGLNAVYSVTTPAMGYKYSGNHIYVYNTSWNTWLEMNQSWDSLNPAYQYFNCSSQEDIKTTAIFKLVPLFSIIVTTLLLIFVAIKEAD